jgi:hypothetical protein
MANGQPKYKGSKGPALEGYERKWAKGKGWESFSFWKGAEAQIFGKIASMQAYCSEITVRSEPPYVTLVGHYGSFEEGNVNETPDIGWELGQSGGSISIFSGQSARTLEFFNPGFIDIVRTQFNAWQRGELGSNNTAPDFDGILPDYLDDAFDMFELCITQIDSIKICQPVISKSLTISDGDVNYPQVQTPSNILIYENTALLQAAIDMPDHILFSVPNGQWLQYSPTVRKTSYDKWEIAQQWEFADEWDDFLYPNRVTP